MDSAAIETVEETAVEDSPFDYTIVCGKRVAQFNSDDIVALASDNKYVEFHLLNAQPSDFHPMTDKALTTFAAEEKFADFLRVHRKALVRASAIAHMKRLPTGHYQITLINGLIIPVSRRETPKVRAVLAGRDEVQLMPDAWTRSVEGYNGHPAATEARLANATEGLTAAG